MRVLSQKGQIKSKKKIIYYTCLNCKSYNHLFNVCKYLLEPQKSKNPIRQDRKDRKRVRQNSEKIKTYTNLI